MMASRSSVQIREMLTVLASIVIIVRRVIQKLCPFSAGKEDMEMDCYKHRESPQDAVIVDCEHEKEREKKL